MPSSDTPSPEPAPDASGQGPFGQDPSGEDHGHDNESMDRPPLPTGVKLAALALFLVIAGRLLGWGSGDDSDPLPVALWCAAGVVVVAAGVHLVRSRRARTLEAQVRRQTEVLAAAPVLTTPDAVVQLATAGVATEGLGSQGGRLVLVVATPDGLELWRSTPTPRLVTAWSWAEVTLREGTVRLGVRNPSVLEIGVAVSTVPLLPAGGAGMWFPASEVSRTVASLEGSRPA